MLPDRILEEGTLRAHDGRVSVSVRLPWYRALPLSSITNVTLAVDGQPVDSASLIWTTADGEQYRLDELPARYDKWWFVLDSAILEGDLPTEVTDGEHVVQVQVGLYIPYLPAGDQVLAIAERDRKTMKLEVAA